MKTSFSDHLLHLLPLFLQLLHATFNHHVLLLSYRESHCPSREITAGSGQEDERRFPPLQCGRERSERRDPHR